MQDSLIIDDSCWWRLSGAFNHGDESMTLEEQKKLDLPQ